MKLKNVGYKQHGKPSDYRAGSVVIPVGELAEVPENYANHLLKVFPGQFVAEQPATLGPYEITKGRTIPNEPVSGPFPRKRKER